MIIKKIKKNAKEQIHIYLKAILKGIQGSYEKVLLLHRVLFILKSCYQCYLHGNKSFFNAIGYP